MGGHVPRSTRVKHFRPIAAENLTSRKTSDVLDQVGLAGFLVRSKSGGGGTPKAEPRRWKSATCQIASLRRRFAAKSS